jgi:short-subunit dehydrogenase involved in D-alanine esterification of teichoic acids
MKELAAQGIETLALDVQSDESIADCVKDIPALDVLVNNAGMQQRYVVEPRLLWR